jgi:hypothetical protein
MACFGEMITWPMEQHRRSSQLLSSPSTHPTTAFFLRHYVKKSTELKNLIIFARNAGKNVGESELPLGHSTRYTQQTHQSGRIKYLAGKLNDVPLILL